LSHRPLLPCPFFPPPVRTVCNYFEPTSGETQVVLWEKKIKRRVDIPLHACFFGGMQAFTFIAKKFLVSSWLKVATQILTRTGRARTIVMRIVANQIACCV
jgi:hypothetical protein